MPELEMFPDIGADEEGEIDPVEEGGIDPMEEGGIDSLDEEKGVPVLVPVPAGIKVVAVIPSVGVPVDVSRSVESLDSEEEELWLVCESVGEVEAT
jgi:hypothetical protein